MGRISNFTIFSLTVCALVILIITYTTSKINNDHEQKLIYSMESKIEYYAKRCYLEGNCKKEMTLQELYDKKYLKEIVDPVTKEVIDSNLVLTYNEETKQVVINK